MTTKPIPNQAPAPHHYLELDFSAPKFALQIIGCGSMLRGDDAAGPVLIRRLWEAGGLGDAVALSDAGTSGMNVAFTMPYAERVVIVDAACSGGKPGTIYRLPGSELADMGRPGDLGRAPRIDHSFRWDQAIYFAQWLLGPHFPPNLEVVLIEGASFDIGAKLTPSVSMAVNRVAEMMHDLANLGPKGHLAA